MAEVRADGREDDGRSSKNYHVGDDKFPLIRDKLLHNGAYGSSVYIYSKPNREDVVTAKVMPTNIYTEILKDAIDLDRDSNILHDYDDPWYDGPHFCDRNMYVFRELCAGNIDQLIQSKKYQSEASNAKFESIRACDQKTGIFLNDIYWQLFELKTTEIMRQAAEGVKYLHSADIVHGDIKPSNFLLFKHNVRKILVKITDFGLVRVEHSGTVLAGTLPFMAPECFVEPGKEIPRTREADFFSLGLTLFYIFTEGYHVYGDDPSECLSNILQKETPAFKEALPGGGARKDEVGLTDEHRITFCDMIRRMLKINPRERMKINDIIAHPTFWHSKTKIDFFRAIHLACENPKFEITRLDLGYYDGNLTSDADNGVNRRTRLQIKWINLPPTCRNQKYSLDSEISVVDLLKRLRNKASHGDHKEKLMQELGFETIDGKESGADWNKFQNAFTGDFPQLLVHLYEKFRNEPMRTKAPFYYVSN